MLQLTNVQLIALADCTALSDCRYEYQGHGQGHGHSELTTLETGVELLADMV